MDEFIVRLHESREAESRRRGDDSDPLNALMKDMEKQLRGISDNRKFAK